MSEGALVYPPICLMSGDRIRPAELCSACLQSSTCTQAKVETI